MNCVIDNTNIFVGTLNVPIKYFYNYFYLFLKSLCFMLILLFPKIENVNYKSICFLLLKLSLIVQ